MVRVNEYPNTLRQWTVGDKVMKVKDMFDSKIIKYDREYTIVKLTSKDTKQCVQIKAQDIGGWWIAEQCIVHAVTGICRECINACKQDKKGTCEFKENKR